MWLRKIKWGLWSGTNRNVKGEIVAQMFFLAFEQLGKAEKSVKAMTSR